MFSTTDWINIYEIKKRELHDNAATIFVLTDKTLYTGIQYPINIPGTFFRYFPELSEKYFTRTQSKLNQSVFTTVSGS